MMPRFYQFFLSLTASRSESSKLLAPASENAESLSSSICGKSDLCIYKMRPDASKFISLGDFCALSPSFASPSDTLSSSTGILISVSLPASIKTLFWLLAAVPTAASSSICSRHSFAIIRKPLMLKKSRMRSFKIFFSFSGSTIRNIWRMILRCLELR